MPQQEFPLRPPSHLEVEFYHELAAPIHAYLAASPEGPAYSRAATLLGMRFKREMARYGYFLTERGLMVQIESDILDAALTPSQLTNLALDMEILRRLTDKR